MWIRSKNGDKLININRENVYSIEIKEHGFVNYTGSYLSNTSSNVRYELQINGKSVSTYNSKAEAEKVMNKLIEDLGIVPEYQV